LPVEVRACPDFHTSGFTLGAVFVVSVIGVVLSTLAARLTAHRRQAQTHGFSWRVSGSWMTGGHLKP